VSGGVSSGIASVQVEIKQGATLLTSGTATVTNGTWSFTYTPKVTGNQAAVATAADRAGNNASATSSQYNIQAACTAPQLTTQPVAVQIVYGANAQFAAAANAALLRASSGSPARMELRGPTSSARLLGRLL
jgi:hypothetical protein